MLRLITVFLSVYLTACTYMGMTSHTAEEMKQKYADDQSKFIDIQGVQMHYKDEGEGETILLLHGIMAGLHTWDEWAEELKKNYRVIRVDLPGFSLTGPYPDGEYTVDKSAALLDEFTDRLGIEKFHLAGNSMGGFISWNFAALHPEKVDRLILVDAAGFLKEPPSILKLFMLPGASIFVTNMTPRPVVSFVLGEVYGDLASASEETIDLYHDMMLREGNRQAVIDVLGAMEDMPVERLKNITAPTLVMWGDQDIWIKPEDADKFLAEIKGSEKIMYKGAGHIPMEEIPEQSVADLVAFLNAGSANDESSIEEVIKQESVELTEASPTIN